MKILESQPRRYDRGISWLSFGQLGKIQRRLVEENGLRGFQVLEIGVGTGTMALLAADVGAHITGFDVSGAMLDIAREKIRNAGRENAVELLELGVSGMDRFADESFDLVMSTLVFSELSHDERKYALHHAFRVLKPGGHLAVADEVRPGSVAKRFLHAAVRIPLLAITFMLTQTTTKAIENLEAEVAGACFNIVASERSALDSFLYLVAEKEERECR